MDLRQIREVYLVGIGGIGMSGLARYFHHRGCRVYGYDRTPTPLTNELISEGMQLIFEDDATQLPETFTAPGENKLVIFTPAIPADSAIMARLRENGFVPHKRSEVLGIISRGMFTIAVAGTHGKTTTSTLIAHILENSGYGCSAFLGGISANYGSNVLYGNNDTLIVEADEYDRSFLTLNPDIAIVTSMDADHLDIYGDSSHLDESFRLFTTRLKEGGKLIRKAGLALEGGTTYSASGTADAMAEEIRIENGAFHFSFRNGSTIIHDIVNGIPGLHNVENAVAAIRAALFIGIDPGKIKAALESFKGVKRRFEFIVKSPRHVYIDDYAHHPEELKACITAVRALYPSRKLTAIFQPHLFTRTRDFAGGFAGSLAMVDELLLLDIYPAREQPIPGVTSAWLLDAIELENKRLCGKQEVLKIVAEEYPELLLTVGAGDIDTLVEPLRNILDHA
jgi:UDP-N-acetylmuramate--alanine ligase